MTAPLCKCGKLTFFVRHQEAATIHDHGEAVSDVLWTQPECDVYRCACGLWYVVKPEAKS